MKKKRFFHILVVCFTVFSLFFPTMVSTPVNEEQDDDLYTLGDGFFWGEWNSSSIPQGLLVASLYFGRSDKLASFNGNLLEQNSNKVYQLNGFIYHSFVIGTVSSYIYPERQLFFGRVDLDKPSFSFSGFTPGIGRVSCSGEYDGSFLPAPTGSYQVGIRSYHLVDETRLEWFTEDESDVREYMVTVWYPTQGNDISKRAEYMDPVTFSWLRDQGPIPLITIPKNAYTFVNPYLYENVEPVEATPFPVLLFSPGYDGVDRIYTSFIDELVSHGYIVVSMNHPYVSGVTVFPDGRAVYIADRPGNSSEVGEFLKRSQQTVVGDVLHALDFVEELNTSDSVLSGVFDCSTVGMFGHSFGGAATLNCCFSDDRIQAGFTLDGVVYDEFITDSIEDPVLLMCAENRFNHSSYDYVWSQFAADAFQVGVEGSAHYGFTDVGVLLSHMLPLIPSELLGFGTVDPQYLIKVTRRFEKAFFDVYLQGVEKEELTSLFDDFEGVLIKEK